MNKIKKFLEKYNNLNIAIKASMWFTVCSILQKGISVITLPIFTRLMTTEEYGEYSVFQTWYNLFTIFITLNIHSEIFNKGLSDNENKKDEFTSNQSGLLIILTTFFGVIYMCFHNIINSLIGFTTVAVLIMLLEILANAIVGLWSNREKFEFNYRKVVIVTVLMSILNPIIGIISVYISKDKVMARIISNAIVPIIFSIFIILILRKKGKMFNNFMWWKKSIYASLPLIPHYLSLVLLNQSDRLMINYLENSSQAGIYSVAYSAGMLMTIINNSINSSFVPWAYKKLKNKNESEIKRTSTSLVLIVLVANLLLIWFAPEIIKILADSAYYQAIWCLVPITASVFFYFIYMLFVDIEIYYGANRYITIASIFAAVLNIILNYMCIPKFGYLAAGYTTLVSYIITMLLHYSFMKITLKKNDMKTKLFDEKRIILFSMILLIMSALAMSSYNNLIVRIIIFIVVIVVLYSNKSKIIFSIRELNKK